MGNVISSQETEDDDLKKYLSEKKESFVSKWDVDSKNSQLVRYFEIKDFDLLK